MFCVSEQEISVNTKYKCLGQKCQNETKHVIRYKGFQPYVLKQLKITLLLTVGNITAGYSIGWFAPFTPKLTSKDPQETSLPHIFSDNDTIWIKSVMIIGAILGSNIFSYIANRIGRKYCLLLVSLFNLAGYIVVANSETFSTLVTGRAIVGAAVGSIIVLNIVYLGEIASQNIRGALTVLTGIFHLIGTILVCSIGPYITFEAVCYVFVAISCLHSLALCYIPESPVYYVMKGDLIEAKLTLYNLGRTEDMDEELKLIKESVTTTLLETEDNYKKELSQWEAIEKKNIKAFIITTVLLSLQVGGGIAIVEYFAKTIFKNEQSSVDPNVGAVILGLTELCGAILTPLLIERFGRRTLLLVSLGCCCLCMGILGTYFYLEVHHYMLIRSIRWVPLLLLMICLFTFNIGLGIVPNTLTSEFYSPRLRTTLSSMSITLAWSVALGTIISFDHIAATLRNHGVFWMYAGINAIGFAFTMFVVPETKGRSLVEIGHLLER